MTMLTTSANWRFDQAINALCKGKKCLSVFKRLKTDFSTKEDRVSVEKSYAIVGVRYHQKSELLKIELSSLV